MPKDAQLTALTPDPSLRSAAQSPRGRGELLDGMESIVHTQELMVFSNQFFQPTLRFDEQDKVLDDVQKTGRLANTAQSRFQRDKPFLPFTIDLLPVAEMFPLTGEAADFGRTAIG